MARTGEPLVRRRHRQCEVDFQLELSRGASCIASSRTHESLRAQIDETFGIFLETYGAERLQDFRVLLASRLVARNRPDAADEVFFWAVPSEAKNSILSPRHVHDIANTVSLTDESRERH